ncbi:unnamed protein product [Parnassius mnemosyne]|uniref:Uncharacterized protein n=1 Tax=Parnassius mnemosyne TaxID=213953 RepID=A0AAV1KL20_9NEOP
MQYLRRVEVGENRITKFDYYIHTCQANIKQYIQNLNYLRSTKPSGLVSPCLFLHLILMNFGAFILNLSYATAAPPLLDAFLGTLFIYRDGPPSTLHSIPITK